MALTLDRGRYYFVLNVPKHLFGRVLGQGGRPVRQALRTADISVARRKAFELEELKRAEWQLLDPGEDALAHEYYAAANRAAESRGFDYVPAHVLLSRSFQENLPRLMAAAGTGDDRGAAWRCRLCASYWRNTSRSRRPGICARPSGSGTSGGCRGGGP